MYLKINAVIRINDENVGGIYRIIALPPGSGLVFLFRLSEETSPRTESDDANPGGTSGRLRH